MAIRSILLALLGSLGAKSYAGDPEQGVVSIEYKSVESARAALLQKPEVDARVEHGWLIVTDRLANTIWTFTEEKQNAHPALVKRVVVEESGEIYIKMNVLCEADKSACDRLVEQFRALNEEIKRALQEKAVGK